MLSKGVYLSSPCKSISQLPFPGAPRFLPLQHAAPWVFAPQDFPACQCGIQGQLRQCDHQEVAHQVHVAILLAAIQAFVSARWAQGGLRESFAAWRLAHAQRCRRRTLGKRVRNAVTT